MQKFSGLKILFFAIFFAILPSSVLGLEQTYPSILGLSIGDSSGLPEYVKYFFNLGMMAGGILAAVVVAIGGILYLLDMARGKFKNEAIEWIKAGIIGLLVLISAYLIVYTINPGLTVLNLGQLNPLTYISNIFSDKTIKSLPTDIYYEIPLGTLTENLIARTIHCYNFDDNGDPIDGDVITADSGSLYHSPTYLHHDRTDCFVKISEAIEKKSAKATALAAEIANMMLQCQCSSTGTCGGTCNPPEEMKEQCKEANDSEDACKAVEKKPCKPAGDKCDLCPEGTMARIKAALGQFKPTGNTGNVMIYDTYEEKDLNVFVNPGCPVCQYTCSECDPADKNFDKCEKEKEKCEEKYTECIGKRIPCIKEKSEWHKLNLADQITFLKQIAESIGQGLIKDYNNLKKGETELSKCYLAESYNDFIRIYEKNDKNTNSIAVISNYKDSIANGRAVNPSKYCQGFQYENSNCYSRCQEQCPGTSADDFQKYSNIQDCDPSEPKYQECREKQAKLVQAAYNKRKCINGLSPFKDFEECFTTCQAQCPQKCATGDTICLSECQENSQCLLDNQDTCLMNFNRLKDCSDPKACVQLCKENNDCINDCHAKYGNLEYKQNCVENFAALCPYCSDQFAGYADCLKDTATGPYDSSSLYTYWTSNPGLLKCPNPKQIIFWDAQKNTSTSCEYKYPETTKCPASSNCPLCPCGTVNTYKNSDPGSNPSVPPNDDNPPINRCPQDCVTQLQTCIGKCSYAKKGDTECEAKINNCLAVYDECQSSCKTSNLSPKEKSSLAFTKNWIFNLFNAQKVYAADNQCTPGETSCCTNRYEGKGGIQYCMEGVNGPEWSTICNSCPDGECCNNGVCSSSNCSGSGSSSSSGSSSGGGAEIEKKAAIKQACSPECDETSFNDDPMTFYCSQTWWKNIPEKKDVLGNLMTCPKEDEIPVGNTIDEAEKWASDTVKKMQEFIQATEEFLANIKRIADEENYCNCNSQCDGKALCVGTCDYNPPPAPPEDPADPGENPDDSGLPEEEIPIYPPNPGYPADPVNPPSEGCLCPGAIEGTPECYKPCEEEPACSPAPACIGNPCQTVINLLIGSSAGDAITKSVAGCPGEGVASYWQKIVLSLEEIRNLKTLNRSDIIKKLAYSREKIATCSQNYLKNTKMLSCTRVENEIIAPVIESSSPGSVKIGGTVVKSYCYGKEISDLYGGEMADNWFCCQYKEN